MINVLFVCLGNICRSPMAEGLFKELVKKCKLDHLISTDSAGTGAYHIGSLPDKRMRNTASSKNIHLDHKARQLCREDFSKFDYIVAMDASNLKNIHSLAKTSGVNHDQIFLMRSFEGNELEVPDPYYGGEEGFEEVYTILERNCEKLLEYILERQKLSKS